MTRLILATCLGLLAAAPGWAQAPGEPGSATAAKRLTYRFRDGQWQRQTAPSLTEEHLEVFRRLLSRALIASYHPAEGTAAVDPFAPHLGYYTPAHALVEKASRRIRAVHPEWHGELFAPAGLVEGVYLQGSGVVFTASLPPASGNPLALPNQPADKPATAWERELRELRGEKPETPAKTGAEPPSPLESVLRLLADNGKHFIALTPDEQVAVALVFRPGKNLAAAQCAQCHAASGLAGPETHRPLIRSAPSPFGGTSSSGGISTTATSGVSSGDPFGGASKVRELVKEIRSGMTLGDLHAKQGKHAEAVAEYQKLLPLAKQLRSAYAENEERLPAAGRLETILLLRELNGKLAQALLAQGKNDEALAHLKEDANLTQELERWVKAPKTGTPPTEPLPGKLVISATKKALDQVGAGKMSFDEFRKAVTVEYTPSVKEPDNPGAKP